MQHDLVDALLQGDLRRRLPPFPADIEPHGLHPAPFGVVQPVARGIHAGVEVIILHSGCLGLANHAVESPFGRTKANEIVVHLRLQAVPALMPEVALDAPAP